MKKQYTYVECTDCQWQLKNNPGRDWEASPCRRCKNTRRMINPQEILCNLCGECMCPDITVLSGKWHSDSPHGLCDAQVMGGYESYHLLDMNRYTFSFCEACLRKLFIQCKIKPDIDDMNFQDEVVASSSWEYDQGAYEYRLWKDAGLHHQAYLNRRCNERRDCPNEAIYTRLINDDFSEECCCEDHKTKDGGSIKHVKFISNVLKPFL